jgi:hypothetical protein
MRFYGLYWKLKAQRVIFQNCLLNLNLLKSKVNLCPGNDSNSDLDDAQLKRGLIKENIMDRL